MTKKLSHWTCRRRSITIPAQLDRILTSECETVGTTRSMLITLCIAEFFRIPWTPGRKRWRVTSRALAAHLKDMRGLSHDSKDRALLRAVVEDEITRLRRESDDPTHEGSDESDGNV